MRTFRRGGQAWCFYVEFDRKNIVSVIGPDIYYLDTFATGTQQAHLGRADSYLYRYYHPFRTLDEGWSWMTRPFWRKRVGGVWLYSPLRTLKIQEHVNPHKAWLKGAEAEWTARDTKNAAKAEKKAKKLEFVFVEPPQPQSFMDIIRPLTPAAQQMQMELATPATAPEPAGTVTWADADVQASRARDFWADWDSSRIFREVDEAIQAVREEDELR